MLDTALSEFKFPAIEVDADQVALRLHDALVALAKISYLYSSDGGTEEEILDVDDYIQTVLIGESLVANRGFNHRDLVRRYRTKPGHIIDGREVAASGISAWYRGQVRKLIDSRDLDYISHDGITSGSAMKVACIAAFYARDFGALIDNTDRITCITHGSIEARLAALLTVLRYYQIYVGLESSASDLRAMYVEAAARRNIEGGEFFLELVDTGLTVIAAKHDPQRTLIELNKIIGLSHAATSVPIAAALWSFRPIDPCEVLDNWSLFNHSEVHTGDTVIRHSDWDYARHRRHFLDLGYTGEDSRLLGEEARSHFDLDTLFSIAFSMMAAENGLGNLVRDGELDDFTDNLEMLARNLVDLSPR